MAAGVEEMTSITKYPAASSDDGYAGTGGYQSAAALRFGQNFGTQNGWVRFPSAGISANADFSSATIAATLVTRVGTAIGRIYGVKQSNPTYPTSTADYDSRPLTTAYVDWTISSGSGLLTSPDLSDVLEEIAAQSGFSDTSAVMLFLKDNGSATFQNYIDFRSYDYGSDIPVLNGTFTEGAPPAGGPVIFQNHYQNQG
jgi:hypothetical protein